jgi:hypothetical protein
MVAKVLFMAESLQGSRHWDNLGGVGQSPCGTHPEGTTEEMCGQSKKIPAFSAIAKSWAVAVMVQ